MTKLTEIYDRFDVVVVPFPFTDIAVSKKRPALILSSHNHFNSEVKSSVMAMITSSKDTFWPLDIEIKDLVAAGLPTRSIIRMKLFTLDHRLIFQKIGELTAADQKTLMSHLKEPFQIK